MTISAMGPNRLRHVGSQNRMNQRRLRQLTAGRRLWLLVGIGLSLLACIPRQNKMAADPDRARLVAAVGERRILHGRASGGFAFGPEISRKRGLGNRTDLPFEVLGAAAEVRKRFDLDPTPTATGNLALAYLLTGDAEKGTRLAELRVLQEETPGALNDLSAAYLERAINEGAPDQFPRAYDAALRALRKQPGQPEALFDRAMAVDGMDLAWIARQSWDEYLAVEPSGPWSGVAREARARAAAREAENDRAAKERPGILAAWAENRLDAVREIATRRPDLAREIIRREALPAVARAKLEGRSLRDSLALAREFNDMAEPVDQDSLDREALVSLERGDRELAAAHIEFAKGSQALDDRDVDKGSPGVLHATTIFRQKGSSYVAFGELQSALVDFFHGKRDGLIERYSVLISGNRGRYPLLRARAHWMRGLCKVMVAADDWQAVLDRREALKILTEARQVDSSRQIASQLWASLIRMGREAEASQIVSGIVSPLSLEDVPVRTYGVIETLTEHLGNRGLNAAALEIRKRSQSAAERGGPTFGANAALDVVELASQFEDTEVVRRLMASARNLMNQIDDRDMRAQTEIVFEMRRLSVPRGALGRDSGDVDRLLSLLRERRNEAELRRALTLIGEKRLADGEPERAEAAFRETLNLQFAGRSRITGEFERIKQFEEVERPADDLVDLLSSTGRLDEALGLVERLRRPDRPAIGAVPRVPEGEGVVSFWELKNRVLASVVTSAGVRHLSLPVGRETLRRAVHRLKASIDVGSGALVDRSLSELYGMVISAVVPALPSIRKLIIVPDRELWDVPFGGLLPRPGDEPLASTFEISFSSSLYGATAPREPWRSPRSILAIGNPSWDRTLFGDLSPLPDSLTEARAVAALYAQGRVLSGADATKAAVQRLSPRFEVVHLATHAIENARDPGESFVLLSPGMDDGIWRASDPGWESLANARLIVLSACRTGNQRSRFGGASFGILRSIQRATTAQVLASTGDVDDSASRSLLEAFHRRLSQGRAPAASLREAQLEARRAGSGLTWMLYRVVI